jgi:hypothetical protein
MIKLGVYPDPNKPPDEAYSQEYYEFVERREWDVNEYNFEVDNHATSVLLEKVTLEAIEFVLQGLTEGAFPTVDDAKEFVGRTGAKGILSQYKIPNSASLRRSVKSPDDPNFTATMTASSVQQTHLHDLDSLDDDELDQYKSIYDINNATIDIPIHGDLNSSAVVHCLVQYYSDLTARCLRQTWGCDDDSSFFGDDADLDPDTAMLGNPWARAGWPP